MDNQYRLSTSVITELRNRARASLAAAALRQARRRGSDRLRQAPSQTVTVTVTARQSPGCTGRHAAVLYGPGPWHGRKALKARLLHHDTAQ